MEKMAQFCASCNSALLSGGVECHSPKRPSYKCTSITKTKCKFGIDQGVLFEDL